MTPPLGLDMALAQSRCQWPSALPCCQTRSAARPAPRAQLGCSRPEWHRDCTLRKSVVGHPRYSSSTANSSRIASYVEGNSSDGAVYQGMFGEWSVEPEDEREVFIYRAGISVAAAGLILASISHLLPADLGVAQLLRRGDDLFAAGGALGLGVSLYFIHIYVTPLKRFVQALWAAGCVGAVAISLSQHEPVVQHVASHPAAVWLVGPFFAAVTGVAFKEGLCYGKAEAAGLFFITPLLLLGHLTGWIPEDGQTALLVAFDALVLVFAARKYTQPVKDDIGDKSVFQFQALPEDEQERRLSAMRAQRKSVPDDDSF